MLLLLRSRKAVSYSRESRARQEICEKYAAMQIAIDSANSLEEIKAVLNV